MQLICHAPIVRFEKSTMEIAVQVWTWLMTVRPDLTKRILSYLVQAWEVVANKGRGMYQKQTQ